MLTYDDLVNDMAAGCKPRDHWRIGIEHEQFVQDAGTGAALPYDGPRGIKALLETMATTYGWQPVTVAGHFIALERDGDTVTLEPGGQVEYSSVPLRDLGLVRARSDRFYGELAAATASLGQAVLHAGVHPHWKREDIHRMPKPRYAIMAPYMETVGRYGVDMMLRTCGVQVNLDFATEADMVMKYRVSLGLQPVMTALLANSSRLDGQETGYSSFRSHIWTDTDPARCGVPAFVFEGGMGFARYVDWALDVPMYFIIRDDRYVDVAGQSFRAFMRGELPRHAGDLPTLSDWHDHLTTLFPEVRLKKYLELRGMDCVDGKLTQGMAAFWTGLLYDEQALAEAWDLIRDWPVEAHLRLRQEVPREGLNCLLPHGPHLRALALDTIEMAAAGLRRLGETGVEAMTALLLDRARA